MTLAGSAGLNPKRASSEVVFSALGDTVARAGGAGSTCSYLGPPTARGALTLLLYAVAGYCASDLLFPARIGQHDYGVQTPTAQPARAARPTSASTAFADLKRALAGSLQQGMTATSESSINNDDDTGSGRATADDAKGNGVAAGTPTGDASEWTRVAVIVPYRNRSRQLQKFASSLREFLRGQRIVFEVFIVEQGFTSRFNRGALFNIGFVEMNRGRPADKQFQCIVLHDVDLIPVAKRNTYDCMQTTKVWAWQLSSAIDVYNWGLPFETTAGGVNMFISERYAQVNGFSNRYFGWGGEDDDLQKRIKVIGGYRRLDKSIGRYVAQKSGHTAGRKNPLRFQLLQVAEKLARHEGLPTIRYRLLRRQTVQQFTLLRVDIWPHEDGDVHRFSDAGLSEIQLQMKYRFVPPPEIKYDD
ncbi:beta-1,4-galactosyltransferase 2-like [Sycon ciliatum]|uniref:beta-1,4-galactosyltransferase 2-like n=1 Tax=Sycon ciliatum TaxID=27933 RepID=UPI0031F6C7CD